MNKCGCGCKAVLSLSTRPNSVIQIKDRDEPFLNINTKDKGVDATINGVNTLTLTATNGLELLQDGDVATISGQPLKSSLLEEISNRENADYNLQSQINQKQDSLDSEQMRAVNSGITQQKVSSYDSHISNTKIHVTEQDKTNWNNKQDALNSNQLNAVNSGITQQKVSSYDSHISNTTIHVTQQDKTNWNNKQNALTQTQLAAVNSGITSSGVSQITTNKNNISNEVNDRENADSDLQDQINNLKARGRFLALWNCATGLAQTNPPQTTYEYKAGDYFIVGTVASSGGTNYRPSGPSYTIGVASTVVETVDVAVDDVYYYDGTTWALQINTQKEVAFVNIAGDPYDNTNLASALNSKQDELTQGTGIDITNDEISVDFNEVATASQGSKADTALQPNDDISKLINDVGYITSSALNGYATEQWVGQQGYLTSSSLSGYATEQWVGQQGYITSSYLSGYLPLTGGNITGDLTIKTDFNVGKLELVDGVKAVEYIETSGGAYSETDYYGNQNTEIEVDVTVLSVPDASTTVLQFCGDLSTAQKLISVSGVRFDEGADAPSGTCRFGNKTQNWPPSAGIQYNKRYKVISNKNYTRRVSTEDTAYPDISLSFLYTGTFTTGGKLWICRTHGSSRYCNARFYGFKIYENGALVRNFVPAKTTRSVTISGQSFAANVSGFFDTVNGKFFKAASGTYTAGSDGVTNYKVSSTSANSLLFGNDGSIKLDAALSTDDYSKKLTTSEWVSDKLKDYLKTDGGNIDGDLTVKKEVSLGDGLVNTVTGYTFYDYISIGPSTYIPINLSRTTDTIKTELDGYFAAFSGHTDFAVLNGSKYNVPISSDAGTGQLIIGNYGWSSSLVVAAGSRFLLKTNRNVAEYSYTTSNNVKGYSTTINTPLCYTPPVSTTINIGKNEAHPEFRVYSMRVYNANTGALTNLFVPAKRTLDNAIGVYDIVQNTFTAASGSNKSLGTGTPEVDMAFFSGTNVALDYYVGSNNTPRIKLGGDGKTELVETPASNVTGKEIVDAEWVLGNIVSSVDSSSTNSNSVGAKLFYDTCGDIEATLNAIRGV